MKTWIHRLGSIKIAVVLLIVVLIALAAGTIIESARGTEAAAGLVYGSLWFRFLLGLFAANVAFALVELWPGGRQRIGFVLTHGSMLLVLLGALVTDSARGAPESAHLVARHLHAGHRGVAACARPTGCRTLADATRNREESALLNRERRRLDGLPNLHAGRILHDDRNAMVRCGGGRRRDAGELEPEHVA